jgi:hypothetical protein
MLDGTMNLPGSHDLGTRKIGCYKCGRERLNGGGVDLGPAKFICGECWRLRATRPNGAVHSLKKEGKRK